MGVSITALKSSDLASAKQEAAAQAQEKAETSTELTTQQNPEHADTVNISAAAQARLLKRDGQTIAQIASVLGVSTDMVREYLGITEDAMKNLLMSSTAKG